MSVGIVQKRKYINCSNNGTFFTTHKRCLVIRVILYNLTDGVGNFGSKYTFQVEGERPPRISFVPTDKLKTTTKRIYLYLSLIMFCIEIALGVRGSSKTASAVHAKCCRSTDKLRFVSIGPGLKIPATIGCPRLPRDSKFPFRMTKTRPSIELQDRGPARLQTKHDAASVSRL